VSREQSRGYQGIILHVKLPRDEERKDDAVTHEKPDNDRGVPSVLNAAPLERQEQHSGCASKQQEADAVEALQLLLQGRPLRLSGLDTEEGDEDQSGEPADREVDIEAPSPGDMLSERAPKNGADDAGDGEGRGHGSGVDGPLMERDDGGDDHEPAREDTRGAETRDGAAYDQGLGCWRQSADKAAYLEDGYVD